MKKHASYYHGERPEVKPFLPDRFDKVLEVGCGDGGFRRLITNSCDYWGIEPEETAAHEAEQRLDKVLHGTFDEVYDQLPDRYFDLVICNDVIEHLEDHDLFIRNIREKMIPGGSIVGSIPNIRYYKALFSLLIMKDWRYTKKGVLDSTHLRFFTKKSIYRSFQNCGFSREKLQGISSAVYLKKKYCTNVFDTTFNVIKYIVRFFLFLLLDVITLGHSSDIKYAQIGFRFRLEN
jgi:2-polyprenyl-3-methyl-5-hydroxy-6-metoxy-1,4-benzoquinol methylase